MNRSDLKQLQSLQDSPSVSILMPTHRIYPANRQDRIRLRNLVYEAVGQLTAQYEKRKIKPLLNRLKELDSRVDFRHTLDGLALFVSNKFTGEYPLPFSVKERVVIGEKFAIRDLAFALNRSPRYWVLVLSEKPTRLYQGSKDMLLEITEGEFPLMHLGPGGAEPLPGGFGIKKSAIRDEYDRQFFRHVDVAFGRFSSAESFPLIVVGVKRNLAFFNEVTQHNPLIAASLEGSHDKTSPIKLGELVWPLVQKWMRKQRREILEEFKQAIGNKKAVFDIRPVWQAVKDGRGAVLLVEKNFHFPVPASGRTKLKHPIETECFDDAVDELIDDILSKNGKVVFLGNNALSDYKRIALILRY